MVKHYYLHGLVVVLNVASRNEKTLTVRTLEHLNHFGNVFKNINEGAH